MMQKNELISARVNLLLPLSVSIQIERESEKRGINRAQYIKEAIHEKLNRKNLDHSESELKALREELKELKYLVISTLDKLGGEKSIQK